MHILYAGGDTALVILSAGIRAHTMCSQKEGLLFLMGLRWSCQSILLPASQVLQPPPDWQEQCLVVNVY